MKSIKFYVYILWLIGLISIPLGMIPPQVMNYLTGILQQGVSQDNNSVLPVIALFFLSIMGVAFLGVIQTILRGNALESLVRNKSLSLFNHIIRVSPDFFLKNQTAKISNRIVSEIRTIQRFLLHLKIGLPIAILGLIFFAYVLFFGINKETIFIGNFLPENYSQKGNWFLASLILILSNLQAFFLLFDKKIQKVKMATAKADDDVVDISFETISNVREIRNNFAFDYAMFRVGKVFERLRKVEVDITKIESLLSGVGPIIDGLIKCFLLAIGARLCLGNINIPFTDIVVQSIEWKDYLGFAGMGVVVDGYVKQLIDYLFRWRMAKESFRRIDEYKKAQIVFEENPDKFMVDGKNDNIIFDKLDFETNNGIKILNGLNFRIKPGEHVAFVGPSGCGKSTTMNLIVQEVKQTLGNLYFGKKNIHDCNYLSIADEIGFVQQKPTLFNISLRDNILLGVRRNSDNTILDNGFPVDVTRLDNCGDQAGLDTLLVSTVKKVGLKTDTIKKGLDNPVPNKFAQLQIVSQIDIVRNQIKEKIINTNPGILRSFNSDKYMFESSILENLIFGMLETKDESHFIGTSADRPSKIFYNLFKKSEVISQLLWIGKQRFLQDQSIAHRIKNHSSKLFEILSAYQFENNENEDLSFQLLIIDKDEIKELNTLSEKFQILLLDIALSTNSRIALSFFHENSSFKQNIINSRKNFLTNRNNKLLNIHSFDLKSPINGVPIRELLIGGQINSEIHGSFEIIDNIIIKILADNNLIDELIMIGLEQSAGEGGQFLSGGQAMKIAIARILLKNPNILLLDEATAALDEKSQAKIVSLVEKEFKNKTVLTISHRLSTIKNYDRIFVFDRGRLVQQGTYDKLLEQEGLFQDLVRQEKGEAPQKYDILPVKDSKQAISNTDIQRAIALSPIFSNLHSEEIELLERMSSIIKCSKETTLFYRGDEGDEFFIILEGEVEFFVTITKNDQSRTDVVDTYGPGRCFGELALFGNVLRTLGARAKTDLKLCSLQRDNIIKLIEINPHIAVSLLETVSKQISEIRKDLY